MRLRTSVFGIAALAIALAGAPAAAATSTGAHSPIAPKVALIVGPVGAATAGYRQLADEAAEAALRFTPNVVKVYSPNATWPAVRAALQDASIVVYLGHGNGWPSRYHDSLFPSSEDGFGLNPVAGIDDDAHQYFGEDRIATDVSLAPNAVVILSRLCYASGNSEPGLPEGSLDDGQQRVDNYAAGFIAAGAGAVIAEAHDGAAWYVQQLLSGKGRIEDIWRSAPTAKGHVLPFDSQRSPGFVARMDPDQASSGFYRSLVLQPGLAARRVGGARTIRIGPLPTDPTLIGTGVTLGAPSLAARPSVGTKTALTIPYKIDDPTLLPHDLRIGVRWDPIDVEPARAAESLPGPVPVAAELVEPEQLGSVVDPVAVKISKSRISAAITVPANPGRYRMVVTLHDATGDAYDAATQALLRHTVVRVTGTIDAAYEVDRAWTTQASSLIDLPIQVTNLGLEAWGRIGGPARPGAPARAIRPGEEPSNAVLVGRWIPLDLTSTSQPLAESHAILPAGLASGAPAPAVLATTAPSAAGNYLLLIDVVVPDAGPLSALGVAPVLVQVTVTQPLH